MGSVTVHSSEPEVRIPENNRELGGAVEGVRVSSCRPSGDLESTQPSLQFRAVPHLMYLLLIPPPAHFDPVCSCEVVLCLLGLFFSPCGVEV